MEEFEGKGKTYSDRTSLVRSLLDRKFTLDEYNEELAKFKKEGPQRPPKDDPEHPLYWTKHVQCLPPLEAYKLVQKEVALGGCQPTEILRRRQWYGWNNFSEFEKEKIAEMRAYLLDTLKFDVPDYMNDREILKFIESFEFNLPKAGAGI